MVHFADISGTEFTEMLGVFVVLLGGFYAFAFKQMREAREERKDERIAFSNVIERLSDSVDRNTQTAAKLNEFLDNLNGSLKKTVKEKQKIARKK